MDETIIIARNWSIILLALESLVLSAIPLFILIKITQGLGKLLPNVRPGLQTANAQVGHWADKVQKALALVDRVLDRGEVADIAGSDRA